MVSYSLTMAERATIEQAVKQAEAQTSGEIVVALARQSDAYNAAAFCLAALFAFVASFILKFAHPVFSFQFLWLAQLVVFLGAFLALHFSGLACRVLPRAKRQAIIRRAAYEQFYHHGLHATPQRAVIFLYISLAERGVELIADQGIHAKVVAETWRQVTDGLSAQIAVSGLAQGVSKTIVRCAEILGQYFPGAGTNSLPDTIIDIR